MLFFEQLPELNSSHAQKLYVAQNHKNVTPILLNYFFYLGEIQPVIDEIYHFGYFNAIFQDACRHTLYGKSSIPHITKNLSFVEV